MQDPFYNPIWVALRTVHRSLALTSGLACKYPQDVAPFAAVEEDTAQALADLRSLMQPGEHTWLFHHVPSDKLMLQAAGLMHEASLLCLQMLFPAEAPLPKAASTAAILPLDATHAPEMVALTDIAYPGFFRARTHVMGHYFGIRNAEGQLIAMCGERIIAEAADGVALQRKQWREISGLCTHPDHRGHGYGTLLLRKLIDYQRARNAVSILHVVASNADAIALYRQLGFETLRELPLHKIVRLA